MSDPEPLSTVPYDLRSALEIWSDVTAVTRTYVMVAEIIDNDVLLRAIARREGYTIANMKKLLVRQQVVLKSIAALLTEDAQARTSRIQSATGDNKAAP